MQISRSGLYELVWKSPLSKAAPEFGISATALAAVCRKYNIPYPGSLYWTMKSMGRPVEVQPLPEASDDVPAQINIEPVKPRKSRVGEQPGEGQQNPHRPGEAPPHKERPVKEHPIITKWIAERERRRREALASRNDWVVKNAPGPITEVDRRRHSILNKLLRAIEEKGGQVAETDKGNLHARIEGEKIEFQIREKQRQTRVTTNYGGYLSSKQELVGTGKLVFAALTYWPDSRRGEWLETDSASLETRIPNMVERLFEGARALKAWHIRLQQEDEQRRNAAAERAERQRQDELERKRRQKLVELATDWQAAAIVRDLVAALRAKGTDQAQDVSGKTIAEWLAWADDVANDLDATRDGASAFFSTIKPEGS